MFKKSAFINYSLISSNDFLESINIEDNDSEQSQLTDENYKLIQWNNGSYSIIPREAYIKKILNQINNNNPTLDRENCIIEEFVGTLPSSDSSEEDNEESDKEFLDSLILDLAEANYLSLAELQIFEDYVYEKIPSMENGRFVVDEDVNYLFSIRHRGKLDLVGAVYFSIDLKTRHAEIEVLSVTPEEQAKGFGSLLTQTALIIASLYGAKEINLMTTIDGVALYIKHDFYFEYFLKDGSQVVTTDVEFIENYIEKNGKQFLSLDLTHSFNKLIPFFRNSLPDFNYSYYELAKTWLTCGEILTKNQGRIFASELIQLKQDVKISDDLLNDLESKSINTAVRWNLKRSILANDRRSDHANYYTSNGTSLFTLFSRVVQFESDTPEVQHTRKLSRME